MRYNRLEMIERQSSIVRNHAFQLIGLGLFALLIRILAGTLIHFDGLYGQDPYAYYDYAQDLAQALAAGQQPPPFFWPLGYPLLVVVGSLFTGWRPLAGQLISIIAGASVAPLVYLLVLEIRPRAQAGALAAGLLAATAGQLTLSSLSVMADTAALAWATLSAWAMLRYLRFPTAGWLGLAAFSLGWAVITRWVYGLVVLPWAAAAVFSWRTAGWPWSRRFSHMGLAVLVGGLILGLQFLLSIGQPEAFTGDLQVYSWSPANAWQRTVTNPDGTFHYEWPAAIFYARPMLHPSYVVPLLFPFWLLGVAVFWHDRRRLAAQGILILGWVLVIYVFLAGVPWQNWRFPLSFFPPLLVLIGMGFQAAWHWLARSKTSKRPRVSLLIGWMVLCIIWTLVWSMRDVRNFASWANERVAAAQWTEAQLPPEATVITSDLTLTLEHKTDLAVEEIYLLNESDLDHLLAEEPELFLLLNLENIANQWAGLSPAENLDWLHQHAELTKLGTWPPYTLFRIDSPDNHD